MGTMGSAYSGESSKIEPEGSSPTIFSLSSKILELSSPKKFSTTKDSPISRCAWKTSSKVIIWLPRNEFWPISEADALGDLFLPHLSPAQRIPRLNNHQAWLEIQGDWYHDWRVKTFRETVAIFESGTEQICQIFLQLRGNLWRIAQVWH